jgi:hypothetical protein
MYDSSVAKAYKVGNVPLLTIVGVLATAYDLMLIYFFLTISSIGVNSPPVLETIGGLILGTAAVYVVIRAIRKMQSIPVGLAFKEIPPE